MRADRLVATLLLLQSKGRVTAAEVAEALEVSERTARRDLESLSTPGIPVYSQQGRGGGWYLVAGTDRGQRTFRVGRVRAVDLTGERVEKPADFDLQAAWEGIATEVDQRRAPFRARARIARELFEYVRWSFGTRIEVFADD